MSADSSDVSQELESVETDLDKLHELIEDFSNCRRDKKKEHIKLIRQRIEKIREGISKSSRLLRSQQSGKQLSERLRGYSQRFRQLSKVAREKITQDKNSSNTNLMSSATETTPFLIDQGAEMSRPSLNRGDQLQQLGFARQVHVHSEEQFIRQREDEIVTVAQELGIIKGLYQEFDELVHEQQGDMDHITTNVHRTRNEVESGKGELEKSQQSMIANRKFKCRLAFGLAFVLAFLIFVLTMKHPWKLPSNISGGGDQSPDPQTS